MTPDLDALAGRLAALAGDAALEALTEELKRSWHAALRVTPATAQDLAACLAAAQDESAAVIPEGGRSQQQIGFPPRRADLLVSTSRLNQRVAWEPGDLTASFEAGITLASAQRQLSEAGQQLAVEAPRAEEATLGGLVASNTSGPRRWRYGRWRDQIIGMEMALPTGELIKSGGRVVKNVQGYDLAKLFIGGLGTLGIITQINVRVIPLPAARRLFCAAGERGPALRLLQSVAGSNLRVSTLDLLDRSAAEACGLSAIGWAALVLVEGSQILVEHELSALARMAAEEGLSSDAMSGEGLEATWAAWTDLGRVDDLSADDALITVSCQPTDVGSVLKSVERTSEENGLSSRCWARTGNGTICVRVSAAHGKAAISIGAFQTRLLDHWPWTALTAGDPDVALAARPWGETPPGLELMRGLKRRFDPRGILQPGRYVARL